MELEKAKVIANGNVNLQPINTKQQVENNDFEVLVDPKEFGIETAEDKRISITDVFAFHESEYNEIVNATEITPEVSKKASSLRKKVGKIRIGIGKIHKAKKEYWINGGRAVDNWKNENTEIVEQKERKLLEIETHFQRIEQERIAKMQAQRIEELKQYEVDGTLIPTIAIMDESIWESFLMGEKLKFEAKKEQERLANAERHRIQEIENLRWKRAEELKPYYSFFTEKYGLNLGECSEDEWLTIFNEAKSAKEQSDAEQARIKAENDKLKAEAQQKEELRQKRSAELKPYIIFIRDYNGLINKEESEYQKELADIKKGAEDHWEFERKEQIRKNAEAEARELELKKERDAKTKLEAELKAKSEAEAKAKANEEARLEAEANMGDKEKVIALIADLESIKIKYQFKSKKNQKMLLDVHGLIDKVILHIKK